MVQIDSRLEYDMKSSRHNVLELLSPFMTTQHEYVGGEGGYCEMLEIASPPWGMMPVVICQYGIGAGYRYWEYASLADARRDWSGTFPYPGTFSAYVKMSDWNDSTDPWFYGWERDGTRLEDHVSIN